MRSVGNTNVNQAGGHAVRTERGRYFAGSYPTRLIPELVLLPLVVSVDQSFKVQAGLLAVIALFAFARLNGPHTKDASFTLLPALAFMLVVTLVFRSDQFRTAILFGIAFAILLALANCIKREVAYSSILAGMVLYLVANIVGWAAGLQSIGAENRIGAWGSTSTLFAERVAFPFASGLNEAPYVAAAVLVAVVAMAKIRRRPLWYHWLGVAAAIFVIMAADNRSALALIVLGTSAIVFTPGVLRAVGCYVAGAALLLPLYVTSVQGYAGVVGGLFGSRSTGLGAAVDRASTFEGRTYIWTGYLRFWNEHFPGILRFLFGYGYQGHVKSGALWYVPLENSAFLRDRKSLHAHNSALQLFLDTGLVGLLLALATVIFVLYHYGREVEMLPIYAAAIIIAFSGVFEVNLSPSFGHAPAFIFLCIASFTPSKVPPEGGTNSTFEYALDKTNGVGRH